MNNRLANWLWFVVISGGGLMVAAVIDDPVIRVIGLVCYGYQLYSWATARATERTANSLLELMMKGQLLRQGPLTDPRPRHATTSAVYPRDYGRNPN